MNHLILQESFVQFLKAVNKINDAAIIATNEDAISCLVGTPDNSCFVYATMPCKATFSNFLNIPSIIKLTKALEHTTGEIDFIVNSNNLEYKSPVVRFKYHLLENGILSQPLINLKKIQSVEFDVAFNINPQSLVDLCKASAFANDSNKMYLSCDGNQLRAELTDRARYNIDSIEMVLGELHQQFDAIPINLDFFRSLTYNKSSTISFKVNSKLGVVTIDIQNDGHKLKYITSAFTS
jgi:DNA polymerase III sliding clamp (beta) subunit (PCNA family)